MKRKGETQRAVWSLRLTYCAFYPRLSADGGAELLRQEGEKTKGAQNTSVCALAPLGLWRGFFCFFVVFFPFFQGLICCSALWLHFETAAAAINTSKKNPAGTPKKKEAG